MKELISGKEALIALANGEEVEYIGDTKTWFSLNKEISSWNVSEVLSSSDAEDDTPHQFRLKPRTIYLNGIEVPAPFEPKIGEKYWIIETSDKNSYSYISSFENDEQDEYLIKLGAWRTEEEVKQVVAALRNIFK